MLLQLPKIKVGISHAFMRLLVRKLILFIRHYEQCWVSAQQSNKHFVVLLKR